jgi:MFS family permease
MSLIGQTICTFYYGFMAFIQNNFFFIFTGFVTRFLHGLFSAFVSVIAFSITTSINEGKELERAMGYMELSWGIGLAIGPAVIGMFFDIGGYCLPFILIGLIYLSGVYLFNNLTESQIGENKSRKSSINSSEGEKTKEKFSFLTVMSYIECVLLVGCIMVELNTTDFYTPTLVNYLNESFSISTSKASFFFLASTLGYIICTQMINKLTDLCNNFKLIFIGHIMGSFCCLLTAPMGILPHNYLIIFLGIFMQGFLQGVINIPSFIEFNNFGKKYFPNNSKLQSDIPSSLINFSFFVGDLFEPVIGAWITAHYDFQASAYFAAFCSFLMGISFGYYHYNSIKGIYKVENEMKLIEKESSINKSDDNL